MTREWDNDPDSSINTLVWHKRPVLRLESGPAGEKAQYGYQRKDNGKVMMTTVRGYIDDSLGAPERGPGEESEPLWLRPRLGAPDRVGRVSTSTNKFFDNLVPRCNCTKTHERDIMDGAGESDYRRHCQVHSAALVDKRTIGDESDDECNCSTTRQWDLQCGREGWDCRRRCRLHGPYHRRVNEDDEAESKWKRILNKCLSVIKDDDDDDDEMLRQQPARAETFLGDGNRARPKSFIYYEKQGLRAMSEPKAARPRSFTAHNNQTLRTKAMQMQMQMQSPPPPQYTEAPPLSPASSAMSQAPRMGILRSKTVAARPSHHKDAPLPLLPAEHDEAPTGGVSRSESVAVRSSHYKDTPLPPLPTEREERSGPAAARPPSYSEAPRQLHRADTARPLRRVETALEPHPKEAPLPPVPIEKTSQEAGVSRSRSVATKASVKRRPRTNTMSTVSTVSTMSAVSGYTMNEENEWKDIRHRRYEEKGLV